MTTNQNPPPPDAYLDRWMENVNRQLRLPAPEKYRDAPVDVADFLRGL